MTAFSEEDMRSALERARNSPATKLAHDTLAAGDVLMRDPRYPDLQRQVGPQAARRLVLDTGMAALSDRFLRDNPSVAPSEPMQAEGERKTFAALQSLFPHLSAGRLGGITGKVFGRLDRGRQLQLASNAADAGAIIGSVLHVDPDAARRRSLHDRSGDDPRKGVDNDPYDRHGRGKRDAFHRDAFGHIRGEHHGGGEQRSASGGGGGERYGALPGNNGITYGAERYSFAQMAQYASAQGVPWAVHSPDLMRLGPSAIKEIAASGIKEPTYKALTNEAKYKAKDVVNLARLAKDTGQDATDLSNDTVKTFKKVEPTAAGRQQLAHIFTDYLERRKSDQKGAAAQLRSRVHERYKAAPAKERELDHLVRRHVAASRADAKATHTAAAKGRVAEVKGRVAEVKGRVAGAKTTKADAKGLELASLLGDPPPSLAKSPSAPAPAQPKAANLTPPTSAKPQQKPMMAT